MGGGALLTAAAVLLATAAAPGAEAHARWVSLRARDPSTGIKDKPCGLVDQSYGKDFDGDPGGARSGLTKLSPGPLTVEWEESIAHSGAPFRIVLSEEHDPPAAGFETCVLLDHIPHDDFAHDVSQSDPESFWRYKVTVNIPDVYCERCVLQLIMADTAKLGPGDNCTYPFDYTGRHYDSTGSYILGSWDPISKQYYNDRKDYMGRKMTACPSVYHSCANLFIDGHNERKGYNCTQPRDWPFQGPDHPYGLYFWGESAQRANMTWKDGWLGEPGTKSFNTFAGFGTYDNATSASVHGRYSDGVRGWYSEDPDAGYLRLVDGPTPDRPGGGRASSSSGSSDDGSAGLVAAVVVLAVLVVALAAAVVTLAVLYARSRDVAASIALGETAPLRP